MTKNEICRKIINLRKDNQRTYIYYIVSENVYDRKLYGLQISCPETNEHVYAKHITADISEIEHVADLAATSFATPQQLKEYTTCKTWI